MDRLRNLFELRRAFALFAAVCMLVSIRFPVWKIVLTAPQYPGRELPVTVYAYPRLGGEYEEIATLNHYVGFYFPDPVFVEPNYGVADGAIATPEWVAFPLLIVALAAIVTFVALSPESRIGRRLTYALVGIVAVFAAALAWAQLRLYQAGHALDPDAPMTGVDGFTPPVLGTYEVANISGFTWFAAGGYLLVAAVVCLMIAYAVRDSDATIRDSRRLVGSRYERMRERFVGAAR